MLPSKMSLSNGLHEEDRVSCLQILAAMVLSFQILLDHSGAMIETCCSKIFQECQHVSTHGVVVFESGGVWKVIRAVLPSHPIPQHINKPAGHLHISRSFILCVRILLY